jgi:hypothetical protein
MNNNSLKRVQATEMRREHSQWRDTNFINKEGFFPVFNGFKEKMPYLSGGAVSLFIYFGLHSNNQTGECYHSINKISTYFNKSTRTINNWIKELEDAKLIVRMQLEINGPSHTFIRPY